MGNNFITRKFVTLNLDVQEMVTSCMKYFSFFLVFSFFYTACGTKTIYLGRKYSGQLGKFQPAEFFLISFFNDLAYTLRSFLEFVEGECTAAQRLFECGLFSSQSFQILLYLLEFLLLFVGELAFLCRTCCLLRLFYGLPCLLLCPLLGVAALRTPLYILDIRCSCPQSPLQPRFRRI